MPDLDPVEQLTRDAVTAGRPRYLTAVCTGALPTARTRDVVDRNSPLFYEALAPGPFSHGAGSVSRQVQRR